VGGTCLIQQAPEHVSYKSDRCIRRSYRDICLCCVSDLKRAPRGTAMPMALRHLADDVRERFARLRVRHHWAGDDATKTKRQSKVIVPQSSSARGASAGDGGGGNGDRTETPDLIRRHVDSARTATLPPLPPTPSSGADRTRRRRRNSAYLCPSSAMGHIYEEIPPTTPPPPQQQQQLRDSTRKCGGAELGRVYYVSPLDGALCRIFPVDERAVHRRQLACAHVRRQPSSDDGRPSPPLVDVASIAVSGLSTVRGRELRLCTVCYRQLRSSLVADESATRDGQQRPDGAASLSPSSFYNSCDLGLLNVPCYYSSEAGDVGDNDESYGTDVPRSSDADTLPSAQDVARRDSVFRDDTSRVDSTARTPPKFGEAGSAFTKFHGGRRSLIDDGPSKGSAAYDEDGRRQQPLCRMVTNSSFDERRRPLRNADDTMLAILDSASDTDFRSRCLHLSGDFQHGLGVERVADCAAKSTSCADVRTARRRSLALRRRSDDDAGRRSFYPSGLTSRRGTSGSRRRDSTCCSGSETSLHGRAAIKSVYYNGLLASMIDLTAAFDRASADDRLSCRATSGPRRSLRSSSRPSSSGQRDFFASAIHHSSGNLMLRSVQ